HEVGCELDAFEFEFEYLTDGSHQSGLAEAGQSFEEDVAFAEDTDEHEAMKFFAAEQNAVELFKRFARQLCRWLQFFRLKYGVTHAKRSSCLFSTGGNNWAGRAFIPLF